MDLIITFFLVYFVIVLLISQMILIGQDVKWETDLDARSIERDEYILVGNVSRKILSSNYRIYKNENPKILIDGVEYDL